MKYQRLVSSTTPSCLQDWLGQELEDRGIDSVYARSILSLLQQDYVDIEPHECRHAMSHQLKVLQKCGGSGKSCYVTKSKHQKWRSREMQILLTSTYPCCNAVLPDIEKLKKKAAVDCLRSASDYINDIEELIDEVWIKLKNIKNLNGEKEDRALRKMDPFFIPPSSPTDEIEKYFAAFPPLNGKAESGPVVDQHKASKNAWCKRCVLKRKSDVHDEAIYNSSNTSSRSPNKCTQPIIPYSSLKTIKNVYKNDYVPCATPNKQEENISFSKSKMDVSRKNSCNLKRTQILKLMSWYARKSTFLCLQIPFQNLSSVTIYQLSMEKSHFIKLLHHTTFQRLATNLSSLNCTTEVCLMFTSRLNSNSEYTEVNILVNDAKKDKSTQSHLEDVSVFDILKSDIDPMKVSAVLESEYDKTKMPSATGLYDPFKVSLSEKEVFEIPQLGIIQNLSFSCNSNISTGSYGRNENISVKNMLDFIIDAGSNLNEVCSTTKEDLLSYGEQYGLGMDVIQLEQHNSTDCTLPEENLIHECRKDIEQCSKMEISEELCSSNILNVLAPEDKIKSLLEDVSENLIHSDEEIFYSDDDSNEIFHSDEEENLFTSFKTHFQPICKSCSMPIANPQVDLSSWNANYSLPDNALFEYQLVGGKCNKTLKNNKIVESCDHDNVLRNSVCTDEVLGIATQTRSLLTSKELTSLTQFQLKINAAEEIYNHDTFQEVWNKGTDEEFSALEENEQNKNISSSNSEDLVKDTLKTDNKMCLFHWGDNHSIIARIWQKNNKCSAFGKQINNSEVITALSKEIKEDGEELLNDLRFMSEFSYNILKHGNKSVKNYIHSNTVDTCFQNGIFINKAENVLNLSSKKSNDESIACEISSELPESVIPTTFAINNEENTSEKENSQCYNLCSSFYESNKYLDSRIFQGGFESNRSFRKGNYLEGGGWSLASDNFSEYAYENVDEKASSLEELELETSEADFELYHQNEIFGCTSEMNEDNDQTESKLALSLLQKRTKQKYSLRKRPCCFFLQGNCSRADCRFSHDLSTTTCRFWKEGSCFKGETCPFLHGYIIENEREVPKRDQCYNKRNLDKSYSLESESDFPSLSSVETQASKGKSAVKAQGKGLKKNKERNILN